MSYRQADIQKLKVRHDGHHHRPNTEKDGSGDYLCPVLNADGHQMVVGATADSAHTTQNADGTGDKMGIMLDHARSHLQHVMDNTEFVNGRLNNIQNILHQSGLLHQYQRYHHLQSLKPQHHHLKI